MTGSTGETAREVVTWLLDGDHNRNIVVYVGAIADEIDRLKARVAELEAENDRLRRQKMT